MDKLDFDILGEIADLHQLPEGSYNVRKNGESVARNSDSDIEIVSKTDKPGIDIIVKAGVKGKSCHIPVILTKENLTDLVYNDFYIGEDSDVVIVAGCGISCGKESTTTEHSGIHSFHLAPRCKVKYIEKHVGIGDKKATKILNPVTEIEMENGSFFEMETVQLGGVSSSVRKTFAKLGQDSKLLIKEKILTEDEQVASTHFTVELNGDGSSVDVMSRSVAKGHSTQHFVSNVIGNSECFGHVECDGIIIDHARITSDPKIDANNVNSSLVHEAAIGKIAGEQIVKLMSLGLDEEEAQNLIIKGFLR